VDSSELHPDKKPSWLKVKFPSHKNYFFVAGLLKEKGLHTICQSAKCPNAAECWTKKTATFLILGDTCTRSCAFCAVKKGMPDHPSEDEARRVAEAASAMNLRYVVATSVTRDDLPDGGASRFAETIKALKENIPGVLVEVLIPDFNGNEKALKTVVDARPDVLNHNLEVPKSLYASINRTKESYDRSLEVLEGASRMGAITKSGLMIGLGETDKDILQAFSELRSVSCDLLTIGQYLRPARNNVSVKKYYSPLEFSQLKKIALDFGFEEVESGPLVRSSYNAYNMYQSFMRKRAQ
jgi:lipoic acid synthetase